MNILITGGAGFIGSHTTVELINAGHIPVIIDDLSNSQESVYANLEEITGQVITHYKGDIRDTKQLVDIISKHDCSAAIHFAAYKAVGESVNEPVKYYRNNIEGTVSLLDAMQQTGMDDLIFSSSCTVYGDPKKIPVSEGSEIQSATNPYGATKQMSEQIINDVCSATNIRAVILRYFNPIGAHPSGLIGELPIGAPNCLVPYLIQATAGVRSPLTVFGDDYDTPDGTAIRDYIHVVDLAKAHVQSINYLSESNETVSVFNIGTGTGTSVMEIINTFEKETGKKVPYSIGARRAGDVPKTFASTKKAEDILGWKAELTVADALRDAWKWQKSLSTD